MSCFTTADELGDAGKIILPGVGHFGQMMRALDRMQVREALLERIRAGAPFLGICLGLQALFSGAKKRRRAQGSEFSRVWSGAFRETARVPHMGWNEIEPLRRSRLLAGLGAAPYIYFAHSYLCAGYGRGGGNMRVHGSLHGRARLRQHFRRAVSSREVGPIGIRIVRNFVELC